MTYFCKEATAADIIIQQPGCDFTEREAQLVSCLVDNELSHPEKLDIFAKMRRNPALAQKWRLYLLMSRVLRSETIDED